MLKKRIIPCLDIKEGRTVKGINFLGLKDAGDPVELAKSYMEQGADELVFLDITATVDQKKILLDLVKEISRVVNIPFTVGGGISSVQQVRSILLAGADKVSLNSAVIKNPSLIKEISQEFGSQCLVVAIDTKLLNEQWRVFSQGGTKNTNLMTVDWAKTVESLGAGEILLTSMNNDGTKNGFALDITQQVSNAVNIPIIASGGAGSKEHFEEVFNETNATGGLAASIFHFGEMEIPDLKDYLKNNLIPVR